MSERPSGFSLTPVAPALAPASATEAGEGVVKFKVYVGKGNYFLI